MKKLLLASILGVAFMTSSAVMAQLAPTGGFKGPSAVGMATVDDSIVYINGDYYLIPCEMRDNDSPAAWRFWADLATKAIPSWDVSIDN